MSKDKDKERGDAPGIDPKPPVEPPAPDRPAGPGPARDEKLDETIPGGHTILADGTHVNAEGEPFEHQGPDDDEKRAKEREKRERER